MKLVLNNVIGILSRNRTAFFVEVLQVSDRARGDRLGVRVFIYQARTEVVKCRQRILNVLINQRWLLLLMIVPLDEYVMTLHRSCMVLSKRTPHDVCLGEYIVVVFIGRHGWQLRLTRELFRRFRQALNRHDSFKSALLTVLTLKRSYASRCIVRRAKNGLEVFISLGHHSLFIGYTKSVHWTSVASPHNGEGLIDLLLEVVTAGLILSWGALQALIFLLSAILEFAGG